jgi:GAF domain-containing protein
MTTTASDLETLVHDLVQDGKKLGAIHLARIAEAVGRVFSVHPDEVAILTLAPGDSFLQFRVPEKLQHVGQIPLSSNSALAARTAREKKPQLINHFDITPHATVFEAVRLKEEGGEPIQKILSAPIVLNDKTVGVIQISRKAKTPAVAHDFSQKDLSQLISIAEVIAPALPLCVE